MSKKNKQKKLLIFHAYDSLNYGAFMMLINFIYYLKKLSNNKYTYSVILNSTNDYSRLKKELGDNQIVIEPIYKKWDEKKTNIFVKVKKIFIDTFWSINYLYFKVRPNACVFLGGDDLSEYYSGWHIVFEFFKLFNLSLLCPVYLVGQTIGPFKSWRTGLARLVLSRCKISVRDSISERYLRDRLDLKNIFKASDLALLGLPNIHDEILRKYHLLPGKYIVLVPSGLIKSYTDSEENYLNYWKDLILILRNRYGGKIVLLAHVLWPTGADDRKIINRLIENIDTKNVNAITEELLASEARSIIGGAYITITGRMHALISSFVYNKPAIAISYSIKYQGIIGDDFDMPELIIKPNKTDWGTKKMINKTINKVNVITKNYSKYQKKIMERKNILNADTVKMIENLVSKI